MRTSGLSAALTPASMTMAPARRPLPASPVKMTTCVSLSARSVALEEGEDRGLPGIFSRSAAPLTPVVSARIHHALSNMNVGTAITLCRWRAGSWTPTLQSVVEGGQEVAGRPWWRIVSRVGLRYV